MIPNTRAAVPKPFRGPSLTIYASHSHGADLGHSGLTWAETVSFMNLAEEN